MASNQNPKLEVPSNEAQTIRQEIIVQKLLNNDKNSKPSDKSVPAPSSIINSSLINQVKAFMPQIKTANDELDKLENKSSVQIDVDDQDGTINGEEDGKPYVEMNLQVYEENSGTSDSDSDSTDSTSSPSSSSSSSEDDDEDTVPSKQQKLVTEIDE